MKQALATAQAPAAIGPYSQGIAAGQTVYVSGQLPIDPATGAIPEGIAAQGWLSYRPESPLFLKVRYPQQRKLYKAYLLFS